MNYLTGKSLPRRTFLRGAGATIALPFLDAMVPASVLAKPTADDPTRLVAIEIVHGAAGSNKYGRSQYLWTPEKEGTDFDLSKGALSSLEPVRDYVTIVSDCDVEPAEARTAREIGGDHFRSSAAFLTQSYPKQTESSDVFAGTSFDQMYAQRFGQDTPIPSMQLCIETVDQAGGCAYGYACVYTDTISWASPTEPLPMTRDPRIVFDQLFGAGGTPEGRVARQKARQSVLDFIGSEVSRLKNSLDAEDVRRMDRYMTDIREMERRIERIVERNTSGELRELPDAPSGVPDSFDEHVKIMFDLQALAFQSDMTRVFSFKLGRDASSRVYPDSGEATAFHPASHHGNDPERVEVLGRINRYHVSLVPYFMEKLRSIQEDDRTLLDKTMILYGSPMGDPNIHNHKRVPFFVAGGANGALEHNLHLRAEPGTPLANVMLTLLHKLGMDDLESFGNSTGAFSLSQAV